MSDWTEWEKLERSGKRQELLKDDRKQQDSHESNRTTETGQTPETEP